MINAEFADLFVDEKENPYRTCIQGVANEPCTVLAILRHAEKILKGEAGFQGLGDASQAAIIGRLAASRPWIVVIHGSVDHLAPAGRRLRPSAIATTIPTG